MVTARSGIEIGARPGVAASISVDGNMIISGISTFGDDITFTGATSGRDVVFDTSLNQMRAQDNAKLCAGTSSDLEIYHNATNSYIDNYTGHIYVRNNLSTDNGGNIYLQAKSGEDGIIVNDDGAVELYHDDSKKLETASGGVTVTGTVAATSYTGDGSSLTGVNAISVAQQFRLASNQSGSSSAGTVLTNWEESDTDYQRIGSGAWSQSSGVFSCSVTGIYLCQWTLVVSDTSTGDAYDPNIQISTDSGSNWDLRSRSWAHVANGTVNRASPQNQFIFDVSNTSTFRLRYRQSNDNDLASGTTIAGSSSENLTNILFIRLGDT